MRCGVCNTTLYVVGYRLREYRDEAGRVYKKIRWPRYAPCAKLNDPVAHPARAREAEKGADVREILRAIPHFQAGPVTINHASGDEIARRAGTPVVSAACGVTVNSTLTTRTRSKVRCPECLEALVKEAEAIQDPHPPFCLAHLQPEPCAACRAYIAGGL